MKCYRCGRVALLKVGDQGFCRAHASEAYQRQAQVIRERERGAEEYEAISRSIQRGQRVSDERFRTRRPHA